MQLLGLLFCATGSSTEKKKKGFILLCTPPCAVLFIYNDPDCADM